MRHLYAGMALLAAAQVCLAQATSGSPIETAPPPVVQASSGAQIASVPPPESFVSPRASGGPAWWADADYLVWWIKRGPLATPLVTTGDPTAPFPGALGQPGTRALFGGSGLDYGTFSGGRVNLGGWLDGEQTIGIEGSGFLLEQRSVRFAIASDHAGNPPIYLPVVNQDPGSPSFGHQSIYTVADPLFPDPLGPTNGSVAVSSTTRLWGAELNGLVNFVRESSWRLDGLVGFRYLDLQESLRLSGFSDDQFDDLQQTFNDNFGTRNQFYGGQLGARFGYCCDRIALDVSGSVAFGSTHQVVGIQGSSVWGGTGFAPPPGVYPGGVFTQPSNIGRTTADHFAVSPQIGVKLRWNLTPQLSANFGYDFLYWSSVVRPGNQIDHNLNATQFPGAGFTGAPLPAPQFNRSDFLAHGVSFGLTFRY